LTVDSSKMTGDGVLRFDGSVETDGKFVIIGGAGDDEFKGGAGNDTFTGGAGSDSLTGGGGKDTFVFAKAAGATSTSFDSITDFDANVDKIDLSFKVTGIDAKITSGSLGFATFDADLAKAAKPAKLAAHHAVLFNPDDGEGAGHNLLIVDVNGQAGYQAGKDLVLVVDGGAHLANLDVSDFI
jgi:Ca2+-binding RTX toxin-like protein